MEVEKKEKKNKIKEEKQIKIEAKAKYIHISSKKVRLVADVIRGMNVNEASSQLKFICKKASGPILKLLRERSVCAPQYLSAGTFTSPMVSCSVLKSIVIQFKCGNTIFFINGTLLIECAII